MLVLDDLHWADQPSLALLQFVARELVGARLLIIGTYRAYFGNELIARARGDLEGARAFCERGLVISPREIRLLFDLAMLDYELGESDRGELHLSGAVELMQSSNPGPTMESSFAPYAIAYIARTEGVAGQKDVLVLARMFEEGGLSTILVTMMPSWAEQYGVPRAMAVEFPFGHPLGLPGHQEMQTMVIKDALTVLEQATEPNTIVHAEHSWPGDESYWRRQWQPATASPLVAKYLHEIRAMRP